MKKLFLGTVIALSALSSCMDWEEQTDNAVSNGSIRASFEQGAKNSRLAMGSDNTLSWTFDDAFKMFDENGNGYAWTLEGEGGITGTFVGTVPVYSIKGAAYPDASTTLLNGNQLTMNLSASLTYEANGKCNIPMWASFSSLNETVAFKHLGALLKINFSDIPAGYSSLIVTADLPIAGKFVADLTNANPILVAAEEPSNSVTVTFEAISQDSEDNDRVFYVPLPVGNYNNINVSISNGTDKLSIVNWSNRNVVRSTVYVASLTYKVTTTTEPAGVTAELSGLSANAPIVQVTMTEPIVATAETAIEIPVIEETSTNVQLNFEKTPITTEETPLVVEEIKNTEEGEGSEDGGTANTNEVSISLPKATETTQETHLEINTPKSTVKLESGKFGKIIASTAQNTLKIGDGVEIEGLIVKKGNVRVSAGGKITGSIEYTGTDIMYLILEYGVSLGADVTTSLTGNIQVMRGFNNKEFSYALHDKLGEPTVLLDENGYALMTQEDIDMVTVLDFGWSQYNIPSLSGIEYFTNLESLTCSDTGLALCDLSKNTNLKNANIQMNQMQSLDFSHCPDLHTLVCSYNQYLVNLNLENCTKLSNLQAQSTGLTTLVIPNPSAMDNFLYGGTTLSYDLSLFTNLTGLGLMDMNLKNLDIIPSQIKAQLNNLFVDNNQLTSFDFTEYPNLSYLHIAYNNLTSLDLSSIKNPSEYKDLICNDNLMTSLDITPLTNLERIFCGHQKNDIVLQLTATNAQETTWFDTWVDANGSDSNENVVVNGNTSGGGSTVQTITIENAALSTALQAVLGVDKVSIDSDGYAIMNKEDVLAVKNLDFRGQKFSSLLGIEYFVNLESLNCSSVGLTSCDLSANTALNNVNLTSNPITTLDMSSNTNLIWLYLGGCTSLTSLQLDGCTNLEALVLNNCKALTSVEIPNKADLLTLNFASTSLSFDLTQFTSLTDLNLGNTGLTSLNIPDDMKSRLKHFSCNSLNLGVLDLSEYPNLTQLNCTYTRVETLDLTKVPNLEVLECQANKMTILDITPLTKLQYLYCGQQENNVVLKLKVTDAQKAKWESTWSTNSGNKNVELYTEVGDGLSDGKGVGAGFGNGGKF